MVDQFLHRCVIAHDKPLELPFTPKYFCKRKRICRRRHTIQIIERTHEGANARINGCLEWWKENEQKRVFRNVRRVVVAPTLCGTIRPPVFCASHDLILCAVIATLKTMNASACHGNAQKRILA